MKEVNSAHINNFNKHETLTRFEPSRRTGNCSYMGDGLKYLGIVNETIYFEKVYDAQGISAPIYGIEGREIVSLPYEDWQDGWSIFINPPTPDNSEKKILGIRDAQGFLEEIVRDYSN